MPWKKRVSETGKGNRKNIILTMKNLRMQRWILNRRDDVMMLYGKQPVIRGSVYCGIGGLYGG